MFFFQCFSGKFCCTFTLAIICLFSFCLFLFSVSACHCRSRLSRQILFLTVNHKLCLKGTNHSYFSLVEGKVNVFSELVCTECIGTVIGNRATSPPGSALKHVHDSDLDSDQDIITLEEEGSYFTFIELS